MKTLCISLIAIPLAILAIGLALPRGYDVNREILIKGTPDQIFSYINNPSQRRQWSPFYSPKVQNRFEGARAGVGAIMHWAYSGGSGRIEITESLPDQRVTYDTHFDNGYPTSTSQFSFHKMDEEHTKVVWDFWGKVPFNPLKRYYIFQIDEKTGGKHFKGLEKLKNVVEKNEKSQYITGVKP